MADLRALSTPSADTVYFLTDPGLEGPFRYLAQDTSSAENYGTVIVGANAARYHRILLDNEIDTGWFGTIGDGANHPLSQRFTTLTEARAIYPHATALTDEIDWCAIQAAINTVKAASATTKAVRIPQGDYVINQAIRAEVDGLYLRGMGAASISIEMDYFGLMVNRPKANGQRGVDPVYNVHVRDLTFRAMKGYGPVNGGIIIFNNSIDLLLDNVTVIGDPEKLTARGRFTNGIATSQGTTGVIRNCVVDGVAKPGYYIANGSRNIRVEACEARNVSGSLGYQPGFAVSGADSIMFIGCHGHHNQGAGLQITCDGYPPGVGTPSTNIQVIGGQYSHNRGHGILMGTNLVPQTPRDIHLIGVETSDNELTGFLTGAVQRLTLTDHIARNNKGKGIVVLNYFELTDQVHIAHPKLSNNGGAGVEIRAVDNVTIDGGYAFDDQAEPTQLHGVQTLPITSGDTAENRNVVSTIYGGVRAEDIVDMPAPRAFRVLDLDFQGSPADAFDLAAAEPTSGYIRITGSGKPEGIVPAPPGSEYSDIDGGVKYIKGKGTGKSGWRTLVAGS
ncbi:right-handed parallel beta-helix repeat-containing protein [Kribbella sp. NPDC050459]|uniref:right-handed parallel beta-helix repeat-containing protein n=1 Tax=Kribbella sp. NPDC050459 TaxID=3155785 RepID=UPI0033D055C7